jgi:hypothetical protein
VRKNADLGWLGDAKYLEQMERDSVARWWQHRQHGHPVLLTTPSTEATERLNQRAQRQRIRAGESHPHVPPRRGRPPSHPPGRRDGHPA